MRRKSFFQVRSCVLAVLSLLASSAAAFPLTEKEDNRPRIFVTDNQGWEVQGRLSASDGQAWGSLSGGSRPQTAEVIKNFNEHCDKAVVTISAERADYVVLFDREAGKGLLRRDNKIAVFNRQGDAVFSDSTVTVGAAVQGACKAIVGHARKARAEEEQQASASPAPPENRPSSPPDRSQYASLRDYDGYVWNSLRREEKLAYLAGHLAALEDLYARLAVEFDLSEAVAPESELVAISSHEQKVRSAILRQVEQVWLDRLKEATHLESSVAEVSRHLDEFYEDASLLKVPIVEAVDVVEMQTRGLPKEKIFRKKAELRSSAGQ